MNNEQLHDLIIIGAAAAGCAAAVYAARRNLDIIIIAKDIGGEVALSGDVENWPGTIHTNGFTLAQDFYKHVQSYNVPVIEGFKVTSIRPEKNYHILTAVNDSGEERTYKTKTVIIASGIHPRSLAVPGEEDLRNKGVTYCTVCDGPLYKKKTTATVGAGNSAAESALMMASIAEKVYVLTKYADTPETKGGFPKAETVLVKKMKETPNIEILYATDTKKILGEARVTGLVYEDLTTKEEKELTLDGVMVHIGMIPNSHFVDIVEKNPAGEIVTTMKCETSQKGIFAAGDVTTIPYKQIAIAAGQGVIAALSAIEYLNLWTEE